MNRNDRRVLIAAAVVGVMALIGIFLLGKGEKPQASVSHTPSPSRSISYAVTESRHAETFPFDPNTADSTQLLRLGLQPWQVRNIYKYRAKGGIYRKKEDFARLYGLTVKDYRRLEPYIRISEDYLPAATLVRESREGRVGRESRDVREERDYPLKIQEGEHVVLNTADTTMLRRVPGIGPYYAKEIIRHGKWLGGYVSVDQLDEIEGFPQESKRFFVIEHPAPRQLNVNKLTLQQLRRHPYINFYQAKAITDYRRLHGDIKSLQDLRFSSDFTDEDIRRLTPYVTY